MPFVVIGIIKSEYENVTIIKEASVVPYSKTGNDMNDADSSPIGFTLGIIHKF